MEKKKINDTGSSIYPEGEGYNKDGWLRAGTVLVPKPEYVEYYLKAGKKEYVVTEEDEKGGATLGQRWMIKVAAPATKGERG